jgi:predicted O-methyltransferase YrrM
MTGPEKLHEKIELYKKLPDKYQITHEWYAQLLAGHERVHMSNQKELHIKPEDPRVIVELGIYEGASSVWWSDHFLDHPESKLICVDPFTGNEEYLEEENRTNFPTLDKIQCIARHNLQKSKNPGKITVLPGASWDMFSTVSQIIKDRPIDILYVDGEHTTQAVIRDAMLYVPLVKPGGLVIFDDYGHEDVRRGCDKALTALDCMQRAVFTGWQLWCAKRTNIEEA